MTTGSSATGLLAIMMLVLAMTSRVRAQTPEAEVLFREGKRLLEEGELEQACEKLEASERLAPEGGTELNLADCWERIGRTASAWAMFLKAAGNAKKPARAAEARRRAALLKDQLVYLTIEVSAEADREDLEITRNDQVVDRALWNQAVPVDPDKYTITARAPKHEEWSTATRLKTKDKVVVVPKLDKAAANKRARRPNETPASTAPNKYRGLSIGLAIGGAAAIGIATAFAFHSRGLQEDSDAICPTTTCGDTGALDLNRRARLEGWVANIGWGLGAAAVAAAIVTWSVGKPDQAVSVEPVITEDRAGVVVGGRF
jgi:hypothetical protein